MFSISGHVLITKEILGERRSDIIGCGISACCSITLECNTTKHLTVTVTSSDISLSVHSGIIEMAL